MEEGTAASALVHTKHRIAGAVLEGAGPAQYGMGPSKTGASAEPPVGWGQQGLRRDSTGLLASVPPAHYGLSLSTPSGVGDEGAPRDVGTRHRFADY